MTFAASFSTTLSWFTLGAQVLALFLIGGLMFGSSRNKLMIFVKKHGMVLALIVALAAMLGSLTYSDIIGYEPCKLCWIQRIAMYPEVIILAIGAYLKDRQASLYALILACIGAPIAWYHYLIQINLIPAPCSAVGYSISCAKVFTMNLGYITIPLMAFTAFILIVLLLLIYRGAQKTETK